jgi:hypothetical protein
MSAKPLFPLGRIISTPGVLEAFQKSGEEPATYIDRHVCGDWGELDPHDKALNDRGVDGGDRIFSSYRLKDRTKVWIITEHDRSVTTVLLPDEY